MLEVVNPMVLDGDNSIELASIAALTLGLIYIGSCNEDVISCIVQALMEREAHDLDSPYARYMALGLGLLFFGKQDTAMASLTAVSVIEHPIKQYIEVLVEGCAYACTGNVLKIQKMFHILSEHVEAEKKKEEGEEQKEEEKKEEEEKKDTNLNHHQSAAVLAIALIAFGEDTGTEMSKRAMAYMLQYGEPVIR